MGERIISAELRTGLWLLWVGVGLGAVLASLGYHWIVSQGVLVSFVLSWCFWNVNAKWVARGILFTAAEIFFKDFDVAGLSYVPAEGPVIFACAPHANQFVDGVVVQKALSQVRKDMGFLTAAKTMRRKYVGALARLFRAIPVERPQDIAIDGKGTVAVNAASVVVKGSGTLFTKKTKPGDLLVISGLEEDGKGYCGRILKVESDTKLMLKRPLELQGLTLQRRLNAASFKIHPRIDQSAVFDSVHSRLLSGMSVGIFPEGGSHDRTNLLPLKAGVSVMALGAVSKYKNLPVKIIPVGINYFRGHRFRSRVFVDIGQPIVPSVSQATRFEAGGSDRRQAQNELLKQVMAGVKSVTIQADSFDTLQFLRAVRRLYKPTSTKVGASDRHILMRAFAEGYERDQEKESVRKLYADILDYRKELKLYSLSDHSVARAEPRSTLIGAANALVLLAWRALFLTGCVLLGMPGYLLAYPWIIITRRISKKKAEEALAKSQVKVLGRDVVATWKIMTSLTLIPFMHTLYTALAYFILGETAGVAYFFFSPFAAAMSIKGIEKGRELLNSIRPLFLALIHPENADHLVSKRRAIQKQCRGIIAELGWDTALKRIPSGTHLFRQFSRSSSWGEDQENRAAFTEGDWISDDEDDDCANHDKQSAAGAVFSPKTGSPAPIAPAAADGKQVDDGGHTKDPETDEDEPPSI